jgi:pilus assembly protein CpaF
MLQHLSDKVFDGLKEGGFVQDDELLAKIDAIIIQESKNSYFTLQEKLDYRREIFHSLRGLDILEDLINDDSISEIMVNGHEEIFIERYGHIEKYYKSFSSETKMMSVIQQIVSTVNRVVNETSPIVDARLPDGSRVNIILPPVALNGPVITIRKFTKEPITIQKLIDWGSITVECAEFLKKMVIAGYNIFISGGTGAGKTTFLNALSQFIPKDERIITIEDSAELKIDIPNLVRLEARNKNLEGVNEITIRDLIRAALRMRPSRIIVGEVRSEEALDMLQAMNTGHDGSISTGHANSSRDMLTRLEMMVLMGTELPLAAIKSQIASALDILIHIERMRDGSRKVVSVEEVMGYQNGEVYLSKIFEYDKEIRCLSRTENAFTNVWKLEKIQSRE